MCKQYYAENNIASVSTWRNSEAINFAANNGITDESLVCFPCRADIRKADIRKVLRDPDDYKPIGGKCYRQKVLY